MQEAAADTPTRWDRFPWGWFVVAEAKDVSREPQRVRYFARELLVARDENGAPQVIPVGCHACSGARTRLDAEGILCARCGAAVDFGTHALPTHSSHGLVFVWHHPEGLPPSYAIPDVKEDGTPGWLPFTYRCMTIRTHPREIVENVVDVGHFVPVHQTDPHAFENEMVGHRAIQRASGVGSAANKYAGSTYSLVATYHGPAYQVTEFESRGLRARLVNAHTPVEHGLLHLRFGVLLEDPGDPVRGERFVRAYVNDLERGFAQDVAIWEHKVYRERPLLCDGDGPIMKLRKWYAQFYA